MISLLMAIVTVGDGVPKNVDISVAGYVIQKDPVTIYDKTSGFYLMRSVECDGSHRSIVLTKRREQTGWYQGAYLSEYHERELAYLRTGRGIAIGDGVKKVIRVLGKPTETIKKDKWEGLLFVGKVRYAPGEGVNYTSEYVFENGKLIEVRLGQDMVPGCGGEDGDFEYGLWLTKSLWEK